ncbi:UNVERIFIED_CONTAM: hypothetical protein PYX00_009788 [Menopon gallinae]|uniref:Glycerate kinase n=1 Tax=Menopon gallinae TaxID=328185 RepID=A0AAW2HDD8_9NEOP
MAVEAERILDNHLRSGVVCVPKNTLNNFKSNDSFKLKEKSVIKVYEGAENNLPDEDAVKGADAIIEEIKSLSQSDLLLVLISGGGSALLPKPRMGLSLEDKLYTMKLLMSSGANIKELNVVRKKLSQLKGGGLAILSYPVKTVTLILSDVVNDTLDVIASGPTVPNTDKSEAAYDILKKYDLLDKLPSPVLNIVQQDFETPFVPTQPKGFCHVHNKIIGNNLIAVREAKNCAERLGYRTVILTTLIDSPIKTIIEFYLRLSFEICKMLYTNDIHPFKTMIDHLLKTNIIDSINLSEYCKGICLIAGGEITVPVKGPGVGGRNQELALQFSYRLNKLKENYPMYFKDYDVTFMSAGTDGIDGNSCAAGAIGCPNTIARAIENFVDPEFFLVRNDSYNFFKQVNKGANLITTGHTGTNVMDIHVICIRDLRDKSV